MVAMVYVSDYPRIQINMSPKHHKEGDDLNLTCTADSNPRKQEIKWIYEGHVTTGETLRLPNLNRTDQGQYRCEVNVSTNTYGDLTNSTDISVLVYCKYYNTVNYAVYVTICLHFIDEILWQVLKTPIFLIKQFSLQLFKSLGHMDS